MTNPPTGTLEIDTARTDIEEFLPFARPDITDAEIQAVVAVLKSGWLTTGPVTRDFEEAFSRFIGPGTHALAVNSATSGLHLALEAVGVTEGDEVITTPYTFTATAEVIRYLGAHPVFVDISPDSMNIDVSQIESRITSRTKAILPVHFGGLACDMPRLLEIARRHNLRVVEDAAHALPATIGGRTVGSLESDVTVFSFYATKTLTTGEGGMLVTRDDAIAERCRVMRLHGISRDVFDRYRSTTPSWQYDVVAPGYKYNLTDIAAALGLVQLERVDAMRLKRAWIAGRYDESFRDLPIRLPAHAEPGDVHAWHLYAIRFVRQRRGARDAFIRSLSEAGIGCSVHFIPLHVQTYWRETYHLAPENFPQALAAYEAVVSLPIYSDMTNVEVDRVIRAVRASAKQG